MARTKTTRTRKRPLEGPSLILVQLIVHPEDEQVIVRNSVHPEDEQVIVRNDVPMQSGEYIGAYEGETLQATSVSEGTFVNRPNTFTVPIGASDATWHINVATQLPEVTNAEDALRVVNCSICLVKQRDAVLMPCMHVPCCQRCASRLDPFVCPVCRTPIQASQQIFLSRAETSLLDGIMFRSATQAVLLKSLSDSS